MTESSLPLSLSRDRFCANRDDQFSGDGAYQGGADQGHITVFATLVFSGGVPCGPD